LRLLVSVIIILAAMIVLFLFLLATDTALSVWHYLKQAPAWLQIAYFAMLLALPLATLLLFWAWFRPAPGQKSNTQTPASSMEQLQTNCWIFPCRHRCQPCAG
jgi:hypothetical protein